MQVSAVSVYRSHLSWPVAGLGPVDSCDALLPSVHTAPAASLIGTRRRSPASTGPPTGRYARPPGYRRWSPAGSFVPLPALWLVRFPGHEPTLAGRRRQLRQRQPPPRRPRTPVHPSSTQAWPSRPPRTPRPPIYVVAFDPRGAHPQPPADWSFFATSWRASAWRVTAAAWGLGHGTAREWSCSFRNRIG